MKIKYIPAFVTLTAGAITSIVCIVQGFDVVYGLELLLGTLVIFLILGILAQKIVIKVQVANQKERIQKQELEKQKKEEEQELDEEEQEEGQTMGQEEV